MASSMPKNRLEAFSDGVLAIVLTVMVLELKVPHGDASFAALRPLLPVFLSYVLSFAYIGIYWNNHHHLLQAAARVNGRILWANLHLLFWLSLLPFVTGWMGENGFAPWPVTLYNVDLLMAGIAYFVLSRSLVAHHGSESALASAVGRDRKGAISIAAYVVAVAATPFNRWIGVTLSVVVALMWLVPDRRIESRFAGKEG
jgi:uncharacterized membrane protein